MLQGSDQQAEDAAIPAIATLKTRPQFLAVRGGARASCPACLIEGRSRQSVDEGSPGEPSRFGFTITKKLGNAVTRNRIRRRLKAALQTVAPAHAKPGFDYVVVARAAAFDRPFAALVADLEKALDALHRRPAVPAHDRRGARANRKAAP